MATLYNPTLKKDRIPNVKGEKYGPVDFEGYKELYEGGYIDDENNLITKKQSNKKPKEENNNE